MYANWLDGFNFAPLRRNFVEAALSSSLYPPTGYLKKLKYPRLRNPKQ